MEKPDMELGARGYKVEHVQAVMSELCRNFPRYFDTFCPTPKAASKAFTTAISEWKREFPAYASLLDPDSLKEYAEDPNSFKDALKRKCPIIRRCLNSSAAEMKKYKRNFNLSTGKELLTTTRKIVQFGVDHVRSFSQTKHEKVNAVAQLGLGVLGEEDYILYGVIGGGIKSQFLYSFSPSVFPNRSQDAIWALYFLSGKKDFGFTDGSEFLMIDANEERSVTQQNYHYPYDLFAYYALRIYQMLKEALAKKGVQLLDEWRYVYLDAFLNHVAKQHEAEVAVLKGVGEYGYEG